VLEDRGDEEGWDAGFHLRPYTVRYFESSVPLGVTTFT